MSPILQFIRHGQGDHNLEPQDLTAYIHDPHLTALGRDQSVDFAKSQPAGFFSGIEMVCASPMHRTIETASLACAPVLESKQLPIVALPFAQETTDLPSDTGSTQEALEAEYDGKLKMDWSQMTPYWNRKVGRYAPDSEALETRAKTLRRWLRERDVQELVLVGHGKFFHYMSSQMSESGEQLGKWWTNVEMRTYCFASEDDDDAKLVEITQAAPT